MPPDAAPTDVVPLRLLVVCTANQCRSPMGEVIARDAMRRRGLHGAVGSAGTDAVDGAPATDGAQLAVRKLGLDLGAHRSRAVSAELVATADVIVGMERHHVIALVTEHGAPLSSTFTLLELAALAESAAPRMPGEPIAEWCARISSGRDPRNALTGADIDDPIGRSLRRYRATARLIVDGVERVLDAFGPGSPTR